MGGGHQFNMRVHSNPSARPDSGTVQQLSENLSLPCGHLSLHVPAKELLDLQESHEGALELRSLSTSELAKVLERLVEVLIHHALELDPFRLEELALDLLQVADLVVLRVALAVPNDRAPEHEFVLVLRQVLLRVRNVATELFDKLVDVVWPLVFGVLKAGREVNRNLADVDLLLFQVDAHHVNLTLNVHRVEVGLNELATFQILEVRRDELLTYVHGSTILHESDCFRNEKRGQR